MRIPPGLSLANNLTSYTSNSYPVARPTRDFPFKRSGPTKKRVLDTDDQIAESQGVVGFGSSGVGKGDGGGGLTGFG